MRHLLRPSHDGRASFTHKSHFLHRALCLFGWLGWLSLHNPPVFAKPALQLFQIKIIRASIQHTKGKGKSSWDLGTGFFGRTSRPDPFVVLTAGGQRMQTHARPNTFEPVWNQTQIFALQPQQDVWIRVYDRDLRHDDLIGESHLQISQLSAKTELRFDYVKSLKIEVTRLRSATQKRATPRPGLPPTKPPPLPPKPRGKMMLPQELPLPNKITPSMISQRTLLRLQHTLTYRGARTKLLWSPDAQSIAIASPGILQVYSWPTMKLRWTYKDPRFLPVALSHAPTRSRFLVGLRGGTIFDPGMRQQTIPSQLLSFSWKERTNPTRYPHFLGNTHNLTTSRRTSRVAWLGPQGYLYQLSPKQTAPTRSKHPHIRSAIHALRWSADGTSLWLATPRSLHTLNPRNKTHKQPLRTPIAQLQSTPKQLLWCTTKGHLGRWSPKSTSPPQLIRLHKQPCLQLQPSKDGRQLVIFFTDKILLWDLQHDRLQGILTWPQSALLEVAYAHSRKTFLLLYQDGSITQWRWPPHTKQP